MGKFTVKRYGTDSSGRPIYMTKYMKQWLDNVLARPKVKPFADKVTIVQGGWMRRAGGGASASEGYHDGGGCLDFRTWNLTTTEVNHLIVAMRLEGAAAWRRDARHGMDPHIHITLGGDKGMTSGAQNSWYQYVHGYNGLASWGSDYEWRPSPIRRFHYKKRPAKPKYPKPTKYKVNRARVNRALKKPGRKLSRIDRKQLDVTVGAIRKNRPLSVEGYSKADREPRSVRRAIQKFQQNDRDLRGDADGLLGRLTCKKLGIRSLWAPLPSWGKKRK